MIWKGGDLSLLGCYVVYVGKYLISLDCFALKSEVLPSSKMLVTLVPADMMQHSIGLQATG
jgi:hypothetical protein